MESRVQVSSLFFYMLFTLYCLLYSIITILLSPLTDEFLRHCVLSGGTLRRALPLYIRMFLLCSLLPPSLLSAGCIPHGLKLIWFLIYYNNSKLWNVHLYIDRTKKWVSSFSSALYPVYCVACWVGKANIALEMKIIYVLKWQSNLNAVSK